jgi:cell wall-associated NlpC family hydrolase
MTLGDPRLTPARPDLAAAALEGLVAAGRYAPARPMATTAPAAGLHRGPDAGSEQLDELVFGERFDALEAEGDFVWGQARRDGHVGFVRAAALSPAGPAPTHRVAAIRCYAFAEPSIKSRAIGPYSLNAVVSVAQREGRFSLATDAGWFWTGDLAPIGAFERDAAAVAERFVGTPYLWGGRTSLGIDCSGLIQQALYACGRAFPRDADLQLAQGRPSARDELARGDLVGWMGHIGMMLDANRLLHATAHHMRVVVEPVGEVIARNEAGGRGPTVFRRL